MTRKKKQHRPSDIPGAKQTEDAELFQQMMSDVRPLNHEPKVTPPVKRPSTQPSTEIRDTSSNGPYTEREHAASLGAEELMLFSRSGIQHRVMKQLKRGDIVPQAKLDLHGQTIAQAGQALHQFLQAAREQQLRCVLVVHGKGSRSADGKPRLKSQVNQWLRDTSAVLAFCSAQARHGGAGAVYVLLKTGT
jgi:DNA-nicking Smr family endonuclease